MLVRLSVRPTPDLSKDERGNIHHFTRYLECQFHDLISMLSKPYNYSPFAFLGYHRLTTNICSEAYFVIIDVDYTSISIHERLQQLSDENLQCILSTTSDPSNLMKYRVILPLSRTVDVREYRRTVMGIKQYGLIADLDVASFKPAQQFYSYADSLVLHHLSGDPVVVEDYLVELSVPEQRSLDPSADITDILHELERYQFATKGSRTRSLLSAGYSCLEYGLTDEQLEQAIFYVNNLFLIPKDTESVYRRVINFIKSQRRNYQ